MLNMWVYRGQSHSHHHNGYGDDDGDGDKGYGDGHDGDDGLAVMGMGMEVLVRIVGCLVQYLRTENSLCTNHRVQKQLDRI